MTELKGDIDNSSIIMEVLASPSHQLLEQKDQKKSVKTEDLTHLTDICRTVRPSEAEYRFLSGYCIISNVDQLLCPKFKKKFYLFAEDMIIYIEDP